MRAGKHGRRILIVGNTGWNVIRYRGGLIQALAGSGWRVDALAAFSADEAIEVAALGAKPVTVAFDGAGLDPLADAALLWRLFSIYRSRRPDVVHHFTIKPMIYGSMAARAARVPVIVNTVTGVGTMALRWQTAIGLITRALCRTALSRRLIMIFQNADDRELMIESGLVRRSSSCIIPGTGVDLDRLAPLAPYANAEPPTFVLAARMLWSKGVGEFVEAAKHVRARHPKARFILAGGTGEAYGSKNLDFIPRDWLEAQARQGVIEWRGRLSPHEVEGLMAKSTAVVLPSYREGLPRSLIEALALGVPVIASDVPGCRETVVDGVNGCLVPPRDGAALGAAINALIETPDDLRRMARQSRKLAVERFDARKILSQHLMLYDSALAALDSGTRFAADLHLGWSAGDGPVQPDQSRNM